MDSQKFLDAFERIADAPNGIARLRELILILAVRGSLHDQAASNPVFKSEARDEIERRKRDQKKSGIRILEEISDDFQPDEIPDHWLWVRLGEIADILDSRRKPITKSHRHKGPIPYYGASGIVDYVADYIFDEPLVLVGEDGAKWARGEKTAFPISGKTWVNNHAHVLRPARSLILDDFLVLCLNEADLSSYITGMTVPKLNQARLVSIPIPLPPLAEQAKIVAKVDELLALCDLLEKQQEARRTLQVKTRKVLIQTVASASASGEVVAGWGKLTDHFGDLYSYPEDVRDAKLLAFKLAMSGVLTKQLTSEQLSRELTESKEAGANPVSNAEQDWSLPSNWGWVRAGWLGEARLGKMLDASKNRGEMMPYLRNINVRWRTFDLSNILQLRLEMHELPKVSVAFGDLVICEGGEPGRAAIWDRDEPFVIQKALHRFRCGPHVLPEYMLLCLEHDYFTGRLDRYYTGATIKHLTGRSLSQYTIPLPPIAEQKRILERVETLLTLCVTMEDQLRQASTTVEALAQAAVSSITGIAITEEEVELKAPQTELIAPLRIGTPPSGSAQAPLASILVRHSGALSAKDLWQRFGGEIDQFYSQLKHEVSQGWIVEPEVAKMYERETA